MEYLYELFLVDYQGKRTRLKERYDKESELPATLPMGCEMVVYNLRQGVKHTYTNDDDWQAFLEERARAQQWRTDITMSSQEENCRNCLPAYSCHNSPGTICQDPSVESVVNVKNFAANGKPTVSCVPPIGFFAMGAAMQDGANKYGRFNWRTTEVTASVFFDAQLRHLLYWYCGEDHAQDSKVHHQGHLQAGGAIIMDAELYGVFKDDRDKTQDPEELLKRMMAIIKKG